MCNKASKEVGEAAQQLIVGAGNPTIGPRRINTVISEGLSSPIFCRCTHSTLHAGYRSDAVTYRNLESFHIYPRNVKCIHRLLA